MTSHDISLVPDIPGSSPLRRPLRLQLSGAPGQPALHGGWWPQSRDIDIELADLVDRFPAANGRVARVLYSRSDWDTQPHSVRVTRGRLKTGSVPRDNTHMIVLSMSTGNQLRLLVVPPDHPGGQRVMAIAADPSNSRSAPEVLATALDEKPSESQDHWTDDGGSWWRREDGPPSYRSAIPL